MARTPEKKVKDRIDKVLKFYGAYSFKPVQKGGYGQMGLDYHNVYLGQSFFIEAKAPGGKVTARQSQLIYELTHKHSSPCFVIDGDEPRDLSHLMNWLDGVDGKQQKLLCIAKCWTQRELDSYSMR